MFRILASVDEIFDECFEFCVSEIFLETTVSNFGPGGCDFERMFRTCFQEVTDISHETRVESRLRNDTRKLASYCLGLEFGNESVSPQVCVFRLMLEQFSVWQAWVIAGKLIEGVGRRWVI